MNASKLRGGLLEAEPPSADLQQRYHERLRALTERRITRVERVSHAFGLAGLMLWAGIETPDPARGNQLILFGLVFWTTMGLPFYLAHMVRQNELRVRLDVLRLELALAERDEARS